MNIHWIFSKSKLSVITEYILHFSKSLNLLNIQKLSLNISIYLVSEALSEPLVCIEGRVVTFVFLPESIMVVGLLNESNTSFRICETTPVDLTTLIIYLWYCIGTVSVCLTGFSWDDSSQRVVGSLVIFIVTETTTGTYT